MRDALEGIFLSFLGEGTAKKKFVRTADRDEALRYEIENGEMLTVHRWFARKSCPGKLAIREVGRFGSGGE